jgi:hypothetical protein
MLILQVLRTFTTYWIKGANKVEDPTVLSMIYKELMIVREDVSAIKEWKWKMAGVGIVISLLATVGFQLALVFLQNKS